MSIEASDPTLKSACKNTACVLTSGRHRCPAKHDFGWPLVLQGHEDLCCTVVVSYQESVYSVGHERHMHYSPSPQIKQWRVDHGRPVVLKRQHDLRNHQAKEQGRKHAAMHQHAICCHSTNHRTKSCPPATMSATQWCSVCSYSSYYVPKGCPHATELGSSGV